MVENNNPNGQSHASDWNDPFAFEISGNFPLASSEEENDSTQAFVESLAESGVEIPAPRLRCVNPKKLKLVNDVLHGMMQILDSQGISYDVSGDSETLTYTDYGIKFICGYFSITGQNLIPFSQMVARADGFEIDATANGLVNVYFSFSDVFITG